MIRAVYLAFDVEASLKDALDGYLDLELLPRGRHMARALGRHLPPALPEFSLRPFLARHPFSAYLVLIREAIEKRLHRNNNIPPQTLFFFRRRR